MSAAGRVRHGWDHPARPSWRQFAVWFLVGPVAVAGLLAAFTPLVVITAPVAAGLVLAVSSRIGFNASIFGALSGVALGPLLIGWEFVADPGSTAWPWFLASGALLAGGIGGYLAAADAGSRRYLAVRPR